jgi:hypothetical protein
MLAIKVRPSSKVGWIYELWPAAGSQCDRFSANEIGDFVLHLVRLDRKATLNASSRVTTPCPRTRPKFFRNLGLPHTLSLHTMH